MEQRDFNARIAEIAATQQHLRPPMIKRLKDESYRSLGYTLPDIRAFVQDVIAQRAQNDLDAAVQAARNGMNSENPPEEMSPEGRVLFDLMGEYFLIKSESKVRVGKFGHRHVNGHTREVVNMWSTQDFKTLMMNKIIGGVKADEIFLTHPDRPEYDGFVVDPTTLDRIVGTKVNLWRGYSVEAAPGPVYWFLRHIVLIMGWRPGIGGAEYIQMRATVNYILDWLAWVIQNPEKRVGVMLVIIGDQGAGKGAVGNLIFSLFGQHAVRIGTKEELVGKHNKHLMGATFVLIDEPPFAGDRAAADQVKGMVTEPIIGIEAKFQDRIEMDNLMSMMVQTNHDWAMHVEYSDRRAAVFEAAPTLLGNTEYFRRYFAKAESKEGKAAVLQYLLDRDVSNFHPEKHRPKTDIYLDQKASSLEPDHRFWRRVINQGSWSITRNPNYLPNKGPKPTSPSTRGFRLNLYQKSEIYNLYVNWFHESRFRGQPSDFRLFWKNFRKWMPEHVAPNERPHVSGARIRAIGLPDFDDMEMIMTEWLRG